METGNLSTSADATVDQRFVGERTITEFWSIGNILEHRAAGTLPWIVGAPYFFFLTLRNVMLFPFILRYTLTNRRIRKEHGLTKRIGDFVMLEDIDDVKVTIEVEFTRVGNIQLIGNGNVLMELDAVQTPYPTRQTILDAVKSRKEILEVQRQQAAIKR